MFEKSSNVTFIIEGMTCEHCVKRVSDALNGLKGVKKAVVSLDKKEANVKFAEKRVTVDQMKKSIENAGYTVTEIKRM